jgi:hypothetical protein
MERELSARTSASTAEAGSRCPSHDTRLDEPAPEAAPPGLGCHGDAYLPRRFAPWVEPRLADGTAVELGDQEMAGSIREHFLEPRLVLGKPDLLGVARGHADVGVVAPFEQQGGVLAPCRPQHEIVRVHGRERSGTNAGVRPTDRAGLGRPTGIA